MARQTLIERRHDIENVIRGTLKVFGIRVGQTARLTFSRRVRELVEGNEAIASVIEPLLKVRETMLEQMQILHRKLLGQVRTDKVCRQLMTAPGDASASPVSAKNMRPPAPGVGAVVAASFKAGVDAPERFGRSRNVGAHFGLTPRRYASGEMDRMGCISKCGDELVRTALYEAATVLLTRVKRWSRLKAWGMKVAGRAGLLSGGAAKECLGGAQHDEI